MPMILERLRPHDLSSVLEHCWRAAATESPVSRVLKTATGSTVSSIEKELVEKRVEDAREGAGGTSGNTGGEGSGGGGEAPDLGDVVDDPLSGEAGWNPFE